MKILQSLMILFLITAPHLLIAQDTLVQDRQAQLKAQRDSIKVITPGIHASHYVFSQSAIPLGKGNFYYHNMYVLNSSAYLGITKNISIGAGVDLLSFMFNGPTWFVLPKAAFKISPSVHIAAGVAFAGGLTFKENNVRAFYYLPYAIATLGDHKKNITIGFGLPNPLSNDFDQQVFNLNGMIKLGKNTSFISENYLIPDESLYLISYGIRYSKRRTGFKLGLFHEHFEIGIIPTDIIPYIGLFHKLESGF